MQNHYHVEARFERSRYYHKTESWHGPARNMLVAMRKAAQDIMRRKSVKRLHQAHVTFHIEKLKDEYKKEGG